MDTKKICIIGGCGHVGLPLGMALASKGHSVWLLDVNARAVEMVNAGKLPFLEEGGAELLAKHIGKNLFATTKPETLASCEVVFFVTGTPVDEHHNPRIHDVLKVVRDYLPRLSKEKLIVLRSTVYPGVMDIVDHLLTQEWGSCKLAFCPERIVQGKGVDEIFQLPQLVSATSQVAEDAAAKLFSTITNKVIRLSPREAEVAKLMTNSWRYLEFAIANQFYMMAESQGLDFFRIFRALREDYPRAQHFARPGLAAGPCLFKDTMQLSAFHKSHFFLGQSAMLVNEGLSTFLVDQMEEKLGSLKGKKVAILGMAFKANNDDTRESLAFKLKKILEVKMATVIASDVYLTDTPKPEAAIAQADGVILGVPHREYLELKIDKPYVDCWGAWRM
jgi:UDP-N-acetyl-D-mannosaminuronic acid dehydrogenase